MVIALQHEVAQLTADALRPSQRATVAGRSGPGLSVRADRSPGAAGRITGVERGDPPVGQISVGRGRGACPRRRKYRHRGRRPLPAHLVRCVHDIHPPEEEQTCPSCGTAKTVFGADVTEELEMIPPKFFVNRYVRHKYACPQCQGSVSQGPLPPRPIDKGIPGPGFLADLIASKYRGAPAAVPAAGAVSACGHRLVAVHAVRLGGHVANLDGADRRGHEAARARLAQGAHRRYADHGAGSERRAGALPAGIHVGVHQRIRRRGVRLHQLAQTRRAGLVPEGLPRLSPGGCVQRIRPDLCRRRDLGGGLLGPRPAEVLRHPGALPDRGPAHPRDDRRLVRRGVAGEDSWACRTRSCWPGGSGSAGVGWSDCADIWTSCRCRSCPRARWARRSATR